MRTPIGDKARAALDAAHAACFKHPDRDVLGMSHGAFSGVNVALGIIFRFETERHAIASALTALATDAPAPLAAKLTTIAKCLENPNTKLFGE